MKKSITYTNPYILFLQSTLAQECPPLDVVQQIDWDELLAFSAKQALVGVVYEGVKICRQQYPSVINRNQFYKWYIITEKKKQRLKFVNRRIEDLTGMFRQAGFRSCVLKGQGIARLYPVLESRIVGDIDIWVEGERKAITDFVHSKTPGTFEQYHHIDFPVFKDINVEVHYLPSQMSSPIHNRRLQNYYKDHQTEQFSNKCPELGENVCIPTNRFNTIFLLSHMMRHFFNEGIGFRQLVDYYYLLKQGFSESDKKDFCETVDYLGMKKFAGAVMWIEANVLGLENEYLLIAPHEKAGNFLFREIMETGNFGNLDSRYSFRRHGALATGLTDIYRDFLLARMFPSEALWKPVAKLINQKWKIKDYVRGTASPQNKQ